MYYIGQLRGSRDAYQVLIFWGALCGWFYWVPLIFRIGYGLLTRLKVVFDYYQRTIQVNGKPWAEFNEVQTVKMLTCVGPLVYRRFRIELICSRIKYLMIVDTPEVADWSCPDKYRVQVTADRRRFNIPILGNHSWHDYQPGMGGFDEYNPEIKEIFTLWRKLCDVLKLPIADDGTVDSSTPTLSS